MYVAEKGVVFKQEEEEEVVGITVSNDTFLGQQ